mgnify:CR=1 FL=1
MDTFTLHPLYSKTSYRNDLAVIHTTEAFKQAPNVNTICLPKPDTPFSEAICTSMGWGVNSEDPNAIGVDIMKQVRLNRVTNRTQCEETISEGAFLFLCISGLQIIRINRNFPPS